MTRSILPPNSLPSERAIETAMRADIDLSAISKLWNPATCPADVLPFLAWTVAISHWNPNWSEAEKRSAISTAMAFHRIKGTRAAVEEVIARFHPLLKITEWWEANPRRDPHTFEVRAPAEITAAFLTPETAEAIIRDIAAAKPLRSHFDFVFALEAHARLYIAGAVTAGAMNRKDYAARRDTSRDWLNALQTEDGEPIFTPDGSDVLETA